MHTTQYLYDVDPSDLPSLVEGFTARYTAAKVLLSNILSEPLPTRDTARQRAVEEAINFCRKFMSGEA